MSKQVSRQLTDNKDQVRVESNLSPNNSFKTNKIILVAPSTNLWIRTKAEMSTQSSTNSLKYIYNQTITFKISKNKNSPVFINILQHNWPS